MTILVPVILFFCIYDSITSDAFKTTNMCGLSSSFYNFPKKNKKNVILQNKLKFVFNLSLIFKLCYCQQYGISTTIYISRLLELSSM